MVDPAGRQGRRQRGDRPLLRSMLGDVLRRTRQQQRRTLADVARAARVSVPYLSELERGRKEASSEVLAAVCDALRLDLSDLLAEAWRELAGTGRDLAGGHARPAQVIRLGSARDWPAPAPAPARRPGDAQCLLAA